MSKTEEKPLEVVLQTACDTLIAVLRPEYAIEHATALKDLLTEYNEFDKQTTMVDVESCEHVVLLENIRKLRIVIENSLTPEYVYKLTRQRVYEGVVHTRVRRSVDPNEVLASGTILNVTIGDVTSKLKPWEPGYKPQQQTKPTLLFKTDGNRTVLEHATEAFEEFLPLIAWHEADAEVYGVLGYSVVEFLPLKPQATT